jgi:hypothetical protein
MANTTNYNWETPDDTDLVKDGALAIRTLGSSIDTTTKALNPSTTLGDIEYRSATANTNTRLGVGTTGQILTVAGGVPSWATPAAAGGDVVKVASGSFSAAGSISVDNCFSSAYDYYKIYVNFTGSSTQNVDLRLRVGGADNTSSNYSFQFSYLSSTTNNANRDASQTGFRIGTVFTGGEEMFSEIALYNPFLAQNTGLQVLNTSKAGTSVELQTFFGSHAVASSFDGFTIYNGGNKTGKYRVYGFKN